VKTIARAIDANAFIVSHALADVDGGVVKRTCCTSDSSIGGLMKVGILGTGDVGQTLAEGFLQHGHQVMMGTRHPEKTIRLVWLKRMVHKPGRFRSSKVR
jgi:phosphoglycerate dehydrogenase-like enzyme